jgi:hypothetical protein
VDRAVRYATIEDGEGVLAFEHVLDEDAALGNFLVDDKLLVIRGDEENHCGTEWSAKGDEDGGRGKGTAERASGNIVFKRRDPLT